MFRFGSKASNKQFKEKRAFAQEAAYTLLMTQLDLGGAYDDHESQQRLLTRFAMGYIFGFADALVQKAGVTDPAVAMADLTLIHVKLFEADQGSRLIGTSFRSQSDPAFMAGRAKGADEAFRWHSDRSFTPIGLTDYLSHKTTVA